MKTTRGIDHLRRGLAYAALPWFRRELPGWRRLCTPLGLTMGHDAIWAGVPDVICRGKLHGYRMILRMDDWCERMTYFLGCYDSPDVHALLRTALKPGDTFVDIGANIGMITLMAARAVGAEGRILAFEPHPVTVERLRRVLDLNAVKNTTVYPIGLGDREGILPLQTIDQSSVWSSFAVRAELPGLTYKTVNVPIRRADDSLPEDLGPRTLIKIDAEGYECKVLEGMKNVLRKHPAVITEVEPDILKSAGSSTEELWKRMVDAGYDPFFCELRRRLGSTGALVLRPATMGVFTSASRDIFWLHPQSPYKAELLRFMG